MRIGITCPLYVNNRNHQYFLDKTTQSIRTSHEWVWIPVSNYVAELFLPYVWHFSQPPAEILLLTGRQPQAITKAWNDGIAKAIALGCEYVLVINHDIVLKSTAIDNLVTFAQEHQEAILWSMDAYNEDNYKDLSKEGLTDRIYNELSALEQAKDDPTDYHEHPHFSSFLVHKSWPQQFGRFDENFVPAYHEDRCAMAQLALAHKKAYVTSAAWFFHFGSRTASVDDELGIALPQILERNSRYFSDKWGCGVLNEVEQMRSYYYQHPYNIEELALNEYIPDYWEFLAKHGADSVSDATFHTLDKQVVLDYLKEKGLR